MGFERMLLIEACRLLLYSSRVLAAGHVISQ